jgi:hypothetical protein
MLRRSGWSVLGACGVLYLASACGSSTSGSQTTPGPSSGTSAGTSGSGGPDLGDVDGNGNGGTGGSLGKGEECAADLVEAQRLPLDMYIMLDVSGSMLVPTEGDENVTKWEAVSSALADFFSDPDSAGIGVGLQVFPLRHPDAPVSCTSNAECAGFESCFLKTCWNADGLLSCDTDDDCGLLAPQGSCVTFGICANDADYVCRAIGQPCGDSELGQDLGDCLPAPPSECTVTADCRPSSYAAPAAAIAALPGAGAALVSTLEASTPDPGNLTPTGPALEGAIQHAKAWALAHPDHQVVAVLATDGQPTLRTAATTCGRVELAAHLQQVVDLAAEGSSSAPAISTFVVGVLSTDDAASGASSVLGGIADAGGTDQAFIIDTQGDVQTKFRAALNAIRAHGLSCELQVPAGEAGKPVSYDEVNVDFTNQAGTKEGLFRVENASACADAPNGRGWYYDSLPAVTKPSRITVCPSVCSEFQTVDMGSVSIALGCEQRSVK